MEKTIAISVAPIDKSAHERFEAFKRGIIIPPPKINHPAAEIGDDIMTEFARLLAQEMHKEKEGYHGNV